MRRRRSSPSRLAADASSPGFVPVDEGTPLQGGNMTPNPAPNLQAAAGCGQSQPRSVFDYGDGAAAQEISLGRARSAFPLHLRTSAGTDNEVNLLNPFIGMYLMVTRKDPRGVVYGADQKISREEALRLYTNAGPYLTFEEKRKGSIEVGKLADMVVLSADYLSVPEEKIKDIVAMETIVGGRSVYRAAP